MYTEIRAAELQTEGSVTYSINASWGFLSVKRVFVCFLLCLLVLMCAFVPLASMAVSDFGKRGAGVVNEGNSNSRITGPVRNVGNGSGFFSIEPSDLVVGQGDLFNMTVAVENVTIKPEMAGAEFQLAWDPTVLKGIAIMKVMLQDDSVGWDNLNSSEGTAFYTNAVCSGSISGYQTLAIITLEAIKEGSTPIHFTFVDTCSTDITHIPLGTVDGNVIVQNSSVFNQTLPNIDARTSNVTCTLKIHGEGSEGDTETSVVVALNETFRVNVDLVNVSDVFGYSFYLCWNSSILNCTFAESYALKTWNNRMSIVDRIDNMNSSEYQLGVNVTLAGYLMASSCSDGTAYTGNVTIATFTFTPINPGTTPLSIYDPALDNANIDELQISAITNCTIIVDKT